MGRGYGAHILEVWRPFVSNRKDSPYPSGRSAEWLKMKNANAPAVKREAES